MSHSGVLPLLDHVAAAVSEAISRIRPDAAGADPVVRRSTHADFQANAALALAKRLQVEPIELAGEIAVALRASGTPELASVQLSGPGFLNLTVSDRSIWNQVAARLADERLGVSASGRGTRVVIDYSAPNIAKEMHVGHLRTTIIGDSLARVLGFLGAEVIRQNHLGDRGTQFGMLIQYLDEHPDAQWRHDDLTGDASSVSALDGLYKAARAAFDADPRFADRSRARVVALQAGDPATLARWSEIVAESEKAFGEIYDRLHVLLTPEDYVGESFYNPMLAETIDELVGKGIVVDSDGALVFFSEEVTGPDDQPVPLMVRKRDGGYGYDTTDLATIRYRINTLAVDRLLYVTDSRQALHFQLVFEAARRAGWLTDDIAAEHIAYGTVLGPDGKPFKTRAGGTVRLLDLLDDAVAKARQVVAEKNPELPSAELDEIAEQAGIGAVKYADLSTSRVKDYTFDLDRMAALNGNTAVYLQYAHARIRSILRKADQPDATVNPELRLASAERALALALDAYGGTVDEVATTLEPHRLCGYLYDLARDFTTFYDNCPVLAAEEPTRNNRLALCRLTARTLRHGLGLLGIAAPERM
ncbi:arginine--tRNA ligase [Nocardia bhagyanarayanae]|uniref:Arginine--tRNA ligase n=1 Tax=Nocardia bhagyanarayanae TaxID=1215925 RepID=A0A543FIL3_9NOCA|nr:arginine--tRNA ligase [Nocardia bhagyanarayanae]TQM33606.1 arginyl-tRNA synthetase [Nocardia bhagyanarayanae]